MLTRLVICTSRHRGAVITPNSFQRKVFSPTVIVGTTNMACSHSITTNTTATATSSPSASPVVRWFHVSSACEATRRRRRGGILPLPRDKDDEDDDNDGDDDSSSGATATPRQRIRRLKEPVAFEEQATMLLDTIFQALQPLQAINDPFILTRARDPDVGNGEYILLELGPLHGQYTIQIDPEDCLIYLQSPISGGIHYFKSLDDDEWRSVDDGHIFQGMLVRDLIRQIQGVPKL
jgi:hypothetical protein